MTKTDQIRAYLKQHGPSTGRQIADALGDGFGQIWGLCSPQVARGLLTFDDQCRYGLGREPLSNKRPRKVKDPAAYKAREKERLRLRNEQRRLDNARARGIQLIQNKAQRTRDHDQRKGEQANAAQAVRLREIGASTEPRTAERAETVAEFMARGGSIQRLSAHWEQRIV